MNKAYKFLQNCIAEEARKQRIDLQNGRYTIDSAGVSAGLRVALREDFMRMAPHDVADSWLIYFPTESPLTEWSVVRVTFSKSDLEEVQDVTFD